MREDAHKGATKADLARLDEKIDACVRRLASEIIKTNVRIDKVEESVTRNTNRVLAAIDRSNQLIEATNRAFSLQGQSLTEVQSRLQNHKKRLGDLETARG